MNENNAPDETKEQTSATGPEISITTHENEKAEEDTNISETSYTEAIKRIQKDFTSKLKKLKTESEKAIKERDELIKQLLTGEGQEPTNPAIDKINERRTFKNW